MTARLTFIPGKYADAETFVITKGKMLVFHVS